MADDAARLRREPPRFRRARVVAVDEVTPWLRRVHLAGEELTGLDPVLPAASVRVLVADPPDGPLVLPTWRGNDFRGTDGSRAPIRTLTPVDADPDAGRLTLDVVRHDTGVLTAWVDTVAAGGAVAVSGPGRGYQVDPGATGYLLVGDESARPALAQVAAALPADRPALAVVEVREPAARVDLPARDGVEVRWPVAEPGAPPGTAMVQAVAEAAIDAGTHVWAAGEAAAVQRIRRHLFDERGLDRARAHVRGYWKVGRAEA